MGGGRNHLPPSNQPKNQSFRLNHGRTLKYRQLLDSRKKKWGQSPQNWARTVESKFQPKCRKSRFFTNFDLVHENGSSSVIFGPIHLISFAFVHWTLIGCSKCWLRKLGMKSIICAKKFRSK